MADNTSQQAIRYYELVRQGVAPAEAFKQAFPNGIPTALDRAKEQAKQNQKQGYGQIAGALAGLAGTKYLMDKIPTWFASEGAAKVAPEIVANVTATTPAAVTGGSAVGGGGAGGMATTTGGSIGALPLAGIAAGTYLGGKAGYDMLKGNKPDTAGRIVLGMATGGLSELAPSLFGHKSTGERQSERWSQLAEAGSAPEWAFANGVNQDQGFGDKDLEAGIDPRQVWASSAMFDTFGKDWANTGTEAQREEITKQILANKLIDTKQGVSYMIDKPKAMDIFNSVIGVKPQPQNATSSPMANALIGSAVKLPTSINPVPRPTQAQDMAGIVGAQKLNPMVQALRTNTISPGIDKNGRRIVY